MDKTDAPTPRIPDGGLRHAMPEWLRRPPAWKARPAEPADAPDGATGIRPDVSPIDPASLVDVDDLPLWLRDIASRRHNDGAEVAPAMVSHPTMSAGEQHAMPNERRLETPPSEPRDVPLEPADKRKWENRPEIEQKTYGGPRPTGSNLPIIIGAIVLLIIIIALIAYFAM